MYQKKVEETSYDKFQKSKEEGMAIMASNRDATLIVAELIRAEHYKKNLSEETVKEAVKFWRKWFFYTIYSTSPDKEAKQEIKEKGNPSEVLGF
jgi:hypothetical protein